MNYEVVKVSWRSIVSRGVFYSLIWWALTDGDMHSWWIGAPAVLLALTASFVLLAPTRLRWSGILRFMPFFLIRSLLGGADVAWRAFHPRMPIKPGLVESPLRLESELPRVVMTNIVSLLPGTLSAEIDRNVLRIHVLDSRNEIMSELVEVEQHVARIFGVELQVTEGGE